MFKPGDRVLIVANHITEWGTVIDRESRPGRTWVELDYTETTIQYLGTDYRVCHVDNNIMLPESVVKSPLFKLMEEDV